MTASERCAWANGGDDYVVYHDTEWGVPIRDDVALFERLSLEAFQSGLSWITVLRKREAFRECFFGFNPEEVAALGPTQVAQLLEEPRIIRHRAKIEATIHNAQTLLRLWDKNGVHYLTDTFLLAAPSDASLEAQGFVRPPMTLSDLPGKCAESEALAKHLKTVGFVFLGPTTLYAALQATGFVNDHIDGCPQR